MATLPIVANFESDPQSLEISNDVALLDGCYVNVVDCQNSSHEANGLLAIDGASTMNKCLAEAIKIHKRKNSHRSSELDCLDYF